MSNRPRPFQIGDVVSSNAHGAYVVGTIVGIDGAYVMINTKTKGTQHYAEYYINELTRVHWTQRKKVLK